MCQGVEQRHKGATGDEPVGVTPAGVPRYYCDLTQVRSRELLQLTKEDLRRDQREDPMGSLVKKAMIARDPHILLRSFVDGAKVVHKEWERMQLEDGIIYRKSPTGESEGVQQMFLPKKHSCVNSCS